MITLPIHSSKANTVLCIFWIPIYQDFCAKFQTVLSIVEALTISTAESGSTSQSVYLSVDAMMKNNKSLWTMSEIINNSEIIVWCFLVVSMWRKLINLSLISCRSLGKKKQYSSLVSKWEKVTKSKENLLCKTSKFAHIIT